MTSLSIIRRPFDHIHMLICALEILNIIIIIKQLLLILSFISTGSCLTVIQKLLLGFSVVGIPYLKDRSSEIQRIINKFTDFSTVSNMKT